MNDVDVHTRQQHPTRGTRTSDHASKMDGRTDGTKTEIFLSCLGAYNGNRPVFRIESSLTRQTGVPSLLL